MLKEIDTLIPIKTSLLSFFNYWLTFLKPFHKLANRELEVASMLLAYRHELSLKIIDEDMLNQVLLNDDSKRYLMSQCNMKSQLLQVILCTLRKKGFLVDNKVNPRYIPHIKKEKDNYQLLIVFNYTDET